jgi:hypothetical protein
MARYCCSSFLSAVKVIFTCVKSKKLLPQALPGSLWKIRNACSGKVTAFTKTAPPRLVIFSQYIGY